MPTPLNNLWKYIAKWIAQHEMWLTIDCIRDINHLDVYISWRRQLDLPSLVCPQSSSDENHNFEVEVKKL